MAALSTLSFILLLSIQAGNAVPVPGEVLSPPEKARMAKATNIEGRIKIYEAASKRIQQTLQMAVAKENFGTVPDDLKLWTSLLSKSLEDIQANLKTNKRSRALIKYEIQVRKSIANTESFKIKAPVDMQDDFDACLSQVKAVRKNFVSILFPQQ
jgi:hypothetical protein